MTDKSNVISLNKNKMERIKVHCCNTCENEFYYIGLCGSVVCTTCKKRVAKCKVIYDAVNDLEEIDEQ
jgi:ribosomal 30S subunit maturation factor RimM